MAKKTSPAKWIFVLLAICVLLPIAAIILLPHVNKSKTKIDYLAEYNRISKPANFDPNDNAAPYFDKAFEVMTEEPNDLVSFRKLWPADMNDDQLQIAKQWVASNTQALDYLKQGITKKCYWKPLEADNNNLFAAKHTYLKQFRTATHLLCLEAKLLAKDGKNEPALEQLIDVYKMGTFLTGQRILIDQLVELAINSNATNSAFQIFDRIQPSLESLKDFQQHISDLSSSKPFLISFTGESLMFRDALDQYCCGRGSLEFNNLYFKKLFQKTVGRAWAVRENRKADIMYDYLNSVTRKTPWQLHREGNDIDKTTGMMGKGTIYLHLLTPACSLVLSISYRAQAQTDALIATTAILRYKTDKGNYPKDLQTLVDSGYLDKLPMDPFSSGPLVYKLTDNNFILYSLAADFNDDGGKHDPKWAGEGDGDYVFWPVQKDPEKETKNKAAMQTADVNSK